MAIVCVNGVDGERVYGPITFDEPPQTIALKRDLPQGLQKPCTQVLLLLDEHPLSDHDKIVGGTSETPLLLTVVLVPYTHSAVVWGWGDGALVPQDLQKQLETGVASVSANGSGFAVVKEDGSVIAWNVDGGPEFIPNAVTDDLSSDVISITGSGYAFAALKRGGRVVTWGEAEEGGDSTEVADLLKSGVISLCSTYKAFAALTESGRVITWGRADFGGDSSTVAGSLADGVVSVHNKRGFTGSAFAAVKTDGSVITWGSPAHGGDSSAVKDQLQAGACTFCGTNDEFAALLKEKGRVVVWGKVDADGEEEEDEEQDSGKDVGAGEKEDECADSEAWQKCPADHLLQLRPASDNRSCDVCNKEFATGSQRRSCKICDYDVCAECFALKLVGTSQCISFDDVAGELSCGVVSITASDDVFVAIKSSGQVVTWGVRDDGADLPQNVAHQLASGVVSVTAAMASFAALKQDGSVVTWGVDDWGGDSSMVADKLADGVKSVFAATQGNGQAFAALKEDGSVVTWGDYGRDSSAVADQLAAGIVTIVASEHGFIALKEIPMCDIP